VVDQALAYDVVVDAEQERVDGGPAEAEGLGAEYGIGGNSGMKWRLAE
jgi:hypothetical protein